MNVLIPCNKLKLKGILTIPKDAIGLILFVHGSGSSRLSTRNQYVAKILNEAKLATLLFDLLSEEEETLDEVTRHFRFDIKMLANRLIDVTNWCLENPDLKDFKIGYFGASTGGGAAIVAAAKIPTLISAIVSRGGRPDLAEHALKEVKAPTLLLVGENDETVIEMNESAMREMTCLNKLIIIPGATHLFEEEGALEKVAQYAKEWFLKYMKL